MSTVAEHTTEENTSQIDRRRFLGTMIVATAGVAFASVTAPEALGSTGSGLPPGAPTRPGAQYMPIGNGAYELSQVVDGQKIVFARIAPDGLLPLSIFGTYVGKTADGFTVAVPKISGTVDVKVRPDTSVQAGGEERLGDLSLLNPGDDVSVGNVLDPNGKRIAEYVRANVLIGTIQVSGVSGNHITGAPLDRRLNLVPGSAPMTLKVGYFATMPTPAPASAEYWGYFATSSSPHNPQEIWAHDLFPIFPA